MRAGWRATIAGADWRAIATTYAIGTAGGLVGAAIGLPLGFMMGALVVIATIALRRWRPLGRAVSMPAWLRKAFVPVLGVAIGGAFTPEVIAEMRRWGPSFLALAVFVPVAQVTGFAIYRAGGIPLQESLLGAMPGGSLEAIMVGEDLGADTRLITVLQLVRVVAAVVSIPMIFAWLTGGLVGSAAGVVLPGADAPADGAELALLFALGVAGYVIGIGFGIPAGQLVVPMVLSAAAHLAGIVDAAPPGGLIALVQIVIGCSLGARFANADAGALYRCLRLGLVNAAAMLLLALGAAVLLGPVIGQPGEAVFLAFAPGGLAEMGLIAVSLDASIVFVTTHHIARIVLSVALVQVIAARLRPG